MEKKITLKSVNYCENTITITIIHEITNEIMA